MHYIITIKKSPEVGAFFMELREWLLSLVCLVANAHPKFPLVFYSHSIVAEGFGDIS